MHFDYTATTLFLAHLMGEVSLTQLLQHPAYQAIFSHANSIGDGLSAEDVIRAVNGEASNFYGVQNLEANLPHIQGLMQYLKAHELASLPEIEAAIERLLPMEDHSLITIHFTIGYDQGIGHKDAVCLNLNVPTYFEAPYELLYLAIHEAFHAVFEHIRPLPPRAQLETARGRLSFFRSLLQNEGYAVYAPLHLRLQNGHLGNLEDNLLKDYQIIFDQAELTRHVTLYDTLTHNLSHSGDMALEEFATRAFGHDRLAYRIGCTIIRRIEEALGFDELKQAIYLSGDEFVEKYDHLLDIYRKC